jgi:hypothetical protein
MRTEEANVKMTIHEKGGEKNVNVRRKHDLTRTKRGSRDATQTSSGRQ